MWWRWLLLVIGGLIIISCVISTATDWVRGKTGPFGPHFENWWGCGAFTVIVILLMAWVGKGIFR